MLSKPKYLSLIILLLAILVFVSHSLAQNGESEWSEPTNLSRSGAASDHHIVVDAQGVIHTIWTDAYDGFIYSSYQAGNWTPPEGLVSSLPPDYRALQFIPAPDGDMHLIWIDSLDSLFYASINDARINSPTSWSYPQLLALSAANANLAVSPDGSVHVTYVRNQSTTDFPAGIYVISKRSTTVEWLSPNPLYLSPYFRGLDPDLAEVTIDAVDAGLVISSWVDPAIEHLYLARSTDNGGTWDEPILVDRRQEADGFSAQGPTNPIISHVGDIMLLIWSAGHQGSNCSLYFSLGQDNSGSWSDPSLLPEPFQRTCPERFQVLVDQEDSAWLFATTPSGIYILAFDPLSSSGSYWSAPQLQTELSSFTNPDTYRQVQLSYQQAVLSGSSSLGDILHVIGIQTSATGISSADSATTSPAGTATGDIWHLFRQLGQPASYFPTPTPSPIWSTPILLAEGEMDINPPVLILESPWRQHAIWTQENDSSIYYAFFDGSRWTQPISVLVSPAGAPAAPSAALTANGYLFLVWADASDGKLYYSYVPTLAVLDRGAWTVPRELLIDGLYAVSPQVQVGTDGRLHIAFAVPLNEGRGIYLAHSTTPIQGTERLTWSPPGLVFDATANEWEMLDHPRLSLDLDDTPHLLWTRYSLPPASQPLGLYYASLPNYETFEESFAAVTPITPVEVKRGQVLWSQLLSSPDGALHRAWQERSSSGDQFLWHSYSLDGGRTWSDPIRPNGFQAAEGPAALAFDGDGRLHLLQIVPTFNGPITLQRWQWGGGESWTAAESQPLPDLLTAQALTFTSASTDLTTLYTALLAPQLTPEPENSEPLSALFFSSRSLSLSGATPTPQPTFTPAPEGSTTSALGSSLPADLTSTPTLTLSTSTSAGPLAGLLSNRWSGIALAAIPVVLIVGVAFVLGARKLLGRR